MFNRELNIESQESQTLLLICPTTVLRVLRCPEKMRATIIMLFAHIMAHRNYATWYDYVSPTPITRYC